MTSKSFLPAAATASLLGLAWLFAAAAPLSGQTPAAPPASPSRTPKPKTSSLRFLNMLPLGGGTLELFASSAPPDGPPLLAASASNLGAEYLKLPPVRTTFRVVRALNRQGSLKVLDVPLKADAYFTILAYLQPDGQPTVELIDDTPNLDLPPANRLVVRQFCHNVHITASAPNRVQTNALGPGETQTLTNLPDGKVPLTMLAVKAPGVTGNVYMDADFQAYRHHTVLLTNDPYDRIRSRVTDDGPTRAEEDAARAAASPTP